MNKQGKIVTLEGAESLVSLARENFKKISLDRVHICTGRFQDILEKVLIEQGNIDFAFIDGHHDKDATLIYFEKIVPFLSDFAIVVLDDISWSKGMKEAWNIIRVDERVNVSVKLGDLGIIIISRVIDQKESYNFYLI
ncbi:class I SAM-dependent methyltransferase [Desulfobacterota bacterium AH_259_B03_O07]|nr:class I SAM-dependent methyltransferase [Desulfobacterota bacterium AH_259_B03_O07]